MQSDFAPTRFTARAGTGVSTLDIGIRSKLGRIRRHPLRIAFASTPPLGANLPAVNNLRWGAGFGGPELESFDCEHESEVSQSISSSGQAYAPEKILKALIRAISVKNWVDGEVSHPHSVIFIGGLQPFECVLLLI
jgi:hypothetical protein